MNEYTDEHIDRRKQVEFKDESWHLSKNVPIAIVAALIVQTFSYGWWMSKLDSRVQLNTQSNQEQIKVIQKHIQVDFLKSDGLAQEALLNSRIDSNSRDVVRMENTLLRMESKIDKIIDSHFIINGDTINRSINR